MPTKKSVINKKSQADRILKKLPANKIRIFLNKFKFNYTFKSSTETYKNGIFNNTLILVLEKYEQIKK